MDGSAALILRPPGTVMRLARMGTFHATRLSFLRVLLRRLGEDGWTADRPVWELNEQGVGHAVYRVALGSRSYSLVAFAHDLPDHLRSDRVIAEAWDATFTLFDGTPTADDIERLSTQVPLQEAGRMSGRELTLSRANRSVRLFNGVVDALANGRQPSPEALSRVGYLMRTTAVYGGAKFGLADREVICDRPEVSGPFQAEMLTVWLIRAFTTDLADHMAKCKGGGKAVSLAPHLRRRLGVGNATGLGMAPFLLNHPALIHKWMTARETALARVRNTPMTGPALDVARNLVSRLLAHVAAWQTDDQRQTAANQRLLHDLSEVEGRLAAIDGVDDWDAVWRWGERTLSVEGQEALVSILLEPHGAEVDDLAEDMAADEAAVFTIDGQRTTGDLAEWVRNHYGWALDIDWSEQGSQAWVWYVSEEKLEPRLGEREAEPLEAYEQPLAPARDITILYRDLVEWPEAAPLAQFLASHDRHRHVVRRCQIVMENPYAEIHDNTVGVEMLPIDLLRAKLSFFGATGFDPKSDRWVRVTLFQDAPYPDESDLWASDDWMWRT